MTRPISAEPFTLRSRVGGTDVIRLAVAGLRAKPLRAVLSAVGIAIGIAAMVSVVGISASSQARINEQLSLLGTNLLSAEPGQGPDGMDVPFPADAAGRVERIPGVQSAAATTNLKGQAVYRNAHIPTEQSGGISVVATTLSLIDVVGGEVRQGVWFTRATDQFPTTVLGADAAERLGVSAPGGLVWLGGQNVKVIGILHPVVFANELNSAALIGIPFAENSLGREFSPTRVYERSTDDTVTAVQTLIGPAVLPETPSTIKVSRPSDALAAQAAVNEGFTGLLLGLGSIALLVGGIGVANTMVIAALERRREIGLRRALGATRRHITMQFLAEALVLSALGGVFGAILGSGVSATVALMNGWAPVIPAEVLAGAIIATLAVGGVAGLFPALRAARTPPTVALST